MSGILGILCFLIGSAMVALAISDLLWTVFIEGGPPITTHVCHVMIRRVMAIQRRHHSRRVVASAGLVAVVSTLITWTLLLWIGWGMVFNGSSSALVDASTGQPADFFDRFYFAGTTIFTLGLGDYKPQGHFWKSATSLSVGSGFLMVGLALAYLMAVVPAATQKRQLGVVIYSLGKGPDDIIIRAWNGVDTTALGPHLVSLIPMLALLGESHLSYPILHYFHSSKRSGSVAVNVAALDESLTILECGLQKGCSLDLPSLGAAREAITEFLQTLKPALIEPAEDTPPVPSLKSLKEMGVPVVDDDLFQQSLAGLVARRRLLMSLVQNEGWTWKAVWPESLAVSGSTLSPASV
jgi:Ion channel